MSAAEFSEWAVYLSQRAAPHSPAQQTPSDMRDGFIASAQAFNTRLRRN